MALPRDLEALKAKAEELESEIASLSARAKDEPVLERMGRKQYELGRVLSRLHRHEEALDRLVEADLTLSALAGMEAMLVRVRFVKMVVVVALERFGDAVTLAATELRDAIENAPELPADAVPAMTMVQITASAKAGLDDEAYEYATGYLTAYSPGETEPSRRAVAVVLSMCVGFAYVRGEIAEALGYAQDATVRWSGLSQSDPAGKNLIRVMVSNAWLLEEHGRGDEANAIYEQVRARFGIEPLLMARQQRARLWHRRVHWLIRHEHLEDLIVISRLLAGEFGTEDDPEVVVQVRDALQDVCGVLGAAERWDESLTAMDGLIGMLERSSDPLSRGRATVFIAAKATMLTALERHEDAEVASELWRGRVAPEMWQAMDDMLSRASDRHSPANLQGRAALLLQRAAMFDELGRADEAVAILEEFPSNFTAAELGELDMFTHAASEALQRMLDR